VIIFEKHPKERRKRLRFYKAALDLLRNSRQAPETIARENIPDVLLHRFYGRIKDGAYFCVQVKNDKRLAARTSCPSSNALHPTKKSSAV